MSIKKLIKIANKFERTCLFRQAQNERVKVRNYSYSSDSEEGKKQQVLYVVDAIKNLKNSILRLEQELLNKKKKYVSDESEDSIFQIEVNLKSRKKQFIEEIDKLVKMYHIDSSPFQFLETEVLEKEVYNSFSLAEKYKQEL